MEDSRRLRTFICDALTQAGYVVEAVSHGEEGLWLARSNDYDAIILDLMLPKLDEISLLQQMRQEGRDAHVLILTAKDMIEDRVHGLGVGADDYLVKPFALEGVLASAQTLVRRTYGIKSPFIDVGSLVIDTSNRSVARNGEPIDLAPREYSLLEFFVMRPGEVVSRTEIEHHIYDDITEPMSNVVDSSICRLRRKIDRPGEPSLIKTRRGMGYVLERRNR